MSGIISIPSKPFNTVVDTYKYPKKLAKLMYYTFPLSFLVWISILVLTIGWFMCSFIPAFFIDMVVEWFEDIRKGMKK